jgi:hypothetical protein
MPAPEIEYVDARNWRAYAIGHVKGIRFHVRKVVWGRLMARAEKRDGEEIRRCAVMVEP